VVVVVVVTLIMVEDEIAAEKIGDRQIDQTFVTHKVVSLFQWGPT
jgi:hypothetical protein